MNAPAVLDSRVETLEREVHDLEDRIRRLEGTAAAPAPAPPPAPVPAWVPAMPSATTAPEPLPMPWDNWTTPNLEDLLGGRLLAIVGGIAFILGIAFLVALAIERGWIGETTRVALGFLASAAVLAAGAWLYERRGQLQASLAMVGAGIAGLYLSLTAATALYSLIPTFAALPCALTFGAVAAALAVRWDSQTLAGLGIVGTLLAPVLGDALNTEGMAFLAIASAAACAVTVWRRWDWLGVVAFLVSMPQVVIWADGASSAAVIPFLTAFAALNLATAIGYEWRVRAADVRPASALIVSFNGLIAASVGYFELPHGHGQLAGGLWIGALAFAHGALGIAALRSRRVSNELGLVLLGAGIALANTAFGVLASGAVLAVGWALSAVAAAALGKRYEQHRDVAAASVGAQLALAIGHTLLFEATPHGIANGTAQTGSAAAAIGAVIVGALAAARLIGREDPDRRHVLDVVAMVGLAALSAAMLDGLSLVLAWSAEAAALSELGRRLDDRIARYGAFGFLGLAAAHVVGFEAPPDALVFGAGHLLVAAGAVAAVAATAAQLARGPAGSEQKGLVGGAIVSVLYLASIAIVTPFQPGATELDAGLTIGVRQEGQALLSAFWGALGLGALLTGLRSDKRTLRLVGFGLLALAVVKVFVYDLAALASVYRVASLVAIGLLLLSAAFAYQRLRAAE
jgi:uncharacterized membrane protein